MENEIGMTALEFANKVATSSIINSKENRVDLVMRVMQEEFPGLDVADVEHRLVWNQIDRKFDQTDREQYAAGVQWRERKQMGLFNQKGFESPSHFFIGRKKKAYEKTTFAESLFASKKQLSLLELKEESYAKAWEEVKTIRLKWSRWVDIAQSLYDKAVKMGLDPEVLTYEEAEKVTQENDTRNETFFGKTAKGTLPDMSLPT